MAETQHEYKNGEKDIEEDFETSEGETEDTSEGKKGIERTSLPEIGEDLSQHEGQNGENHEASLAYMPKDDQHHAEAQPHKVEQTNHERQSSHEEESDKDGKKKESQPSHDRDFGETDDEQARSQQKEPDQSQNHDEHGEKDTNNQAHNEALNLQPESLSQGNPKISDTQPLTPSASSLTNNLSIARPDPVDQVKLSRRILPFCQVLVFKAILWLPLLRMRSRWNYFQSKSPIKNMALCVGDGEQCSLLQGRLALSLSHQDRTALKSWKLCDLAFTTSATRTSYSKRC